MLSSTPESGVSLWNVIWSKSVTMPKLWSLVFPHSQGTLNFYYEQTEIILSGRIRPRPNLYYTLIPNIKREKHWRKYLE